MEMHLYINEAAERWLTLLITSCRALDAAARLAHCVVKFASFAWRDKNAAELLIVEGFYG
jgi:hypothetical protein